MYPEYRLRCQCPSSRGHWSCWAKPWRKNQTGSLYGKVFYIHLLSPFMASLIYFTWRVYIFSLPLKSCTAMHLQLPCLWGYYVSSLSTFPGPLGHCESTLVASITVRSALSTVHISTTEDDNSLYAYLNGPRQGHHALIERLTPVAVWDFATGTAIRVSV